ncbi:FkbM family methyltransferase [bacterium]|nr:FkbM family methyltransferase [bacterium]
MSEKSLYDKLCKKKFNPQHAAEVGVYHPETSNIYGYIKSGVRSTLVEPDPESIKRIKSHFKGLESLTLYECAIYDYNGEIKLAQRDASSFIADLSVAPAIVNDNYVLKDEDKITVECRTFDEIDDGGIDLLSIDTEGSEWYVIKNMSSRPAVISLETHGAAYINPFISQILSWMNENNYIVWYKTGSDTVFVKKESFKITFWERISLYFKESGLFLRRMRKRVGKRIFPKKP